jgi:hypothetical protein
MLLVLKFVLKKSKANQRSALDAIGKVLEVVGDDLSPWYRVTSSELKRFGVEILRGKDYYGSIMNMLVNIYPEYNWYPFIILVLSDKVLLTLFS